MARTLKCIGAIGRPDPRHSATEMWALRVEREQSIGTMHEEELALDIPQRRCFDRRHVLGAHGDLAAESAGLVWPEQQPSRRAEERQHRSHRAESGLA